MKNLSKLLAMLLAVIMVLSVVAASAETVYERGDDDEIYDEVFDEYNELIWSAFNENDRGTRAGILHDAEKLLINDMPVIPLIVYKDAYIHSGDLSDIGTDYFTTRNFKETSLKKYWRFKESE